MDRIEWKRGCKKRFIWFQMLASFEVLIDAFVEFPQVGPRCLVEVCCLLRATHLIVA